MNSQIWNFDEIQSHGSLGGQLGNKHTPLPEV